MLTTIFYKNATLRRARRLQIVLCLFFFAEKTRRSTPHRAEFGKHIGKRSARVHQGGVQHTAAVSLCYVKRGLKLSTKKKNHCERTRFVYGTRKLIRFRESFGKSRAHSTIPATRLKKMSTEMASRAQEGGGRRWVTRKNTSHVFLENRSTI